MVGREIGFSPDRGNVQKGECRLQLENLSCGSDRGTPGLRGVSLELCSGEILGVAGVSGNGQRELAETITGLRKITGGRVILEGDDVTGFAPGDLTERMLSYIPEERMRDGMIKNFSIAENMVLREHHKQPFSRSGFLNLRDISIHSDELIKKFHVKTPSRDTLAKNLSGGNIQKVVLAREISRNRTQLLPSHSWAGHRTTEYVRDNYWSSAGKVRR
jgi:simple sugar transport system ATP-binding protein